MRISRNDGSLTLIAKYSLDDADLIERFRWHLQLEYRKTRAANSYPATIIEYPGHKRLTVFMGQLVLGKPGRVDHLNGNGMDNRRENLRIATQSQILAKRRPAGGASRYKGVSWDVWHSRWVARFRGKNLGRFEHEDDAARAFDDAAFEYWGHQAYFNFPDEIADWTWPPPPRPARRR